MRVSAQLRYRVSEHCSLPLNRFFLAAEPLWAGVEERMHGRESLKREF